MPDEDNQPGSETLERKLATILSADVAEFSRLMGEDEEETLRIFRGHKKVFESLVPMHRGRIFNTAGDAILAEFGSAVEAVRCATDIQSALRTRNDQLAPARQVRFRIGINLGDIMVQDQDLMGDGVNVAARLQTAAEPGGICISGSVHDQIRDKLSLSFQSLGERNFKNIQQPVRTFSITEAEGGGTLPAPKPDSGKGGMAKWIAAALLLLVLAGGGYGAYVFNERSKVEAVRAIAATAPPSLPAPVAKPAVEKARNDQPGKAANSAGPAGESKALTTAAATAPSVVRAGSYDGVFSGPVCYGKTANEPARCYNAEGAISGGTITGEWVMPGMAGITMFLAGHVATSGDVTIHMHSQRPDGTRVAMIDLTGTLRERQINASGGFRNGREVTLTWQRNSAASK